MSKTYRAPRKFQVSGKAGKLKIKASFHSMEANLIAHEIQQKRKLAKLRKKDRQWKLASAAAAEGRLLHAH